MPAPKVTLRVMAGISSGLKHLLPGSQIAVHVERSGELPEGDAPERLHAGAGSVVTNQEATFWVALAEEHVGVLTVSRDFIPFSEAEQVLLAHIEETLRYIPLDTAEEAQAEFVANPHAFERMVIVQYLRGKLKQSHHIWAQGLLIDQLVDLAVDRHEQQATMSGVVVAARPADYLRDQVEPSCYEFEPFPEPIEIGQSFFDRPASHRYVDGRNALYLADRRLEVRGVLRCTDPNRFGHVARAANEHLVPLMQNDASEVWIGYVGNNHAVNVVVTQRKHLRWLKSHWHFVDQYHLSNALAQQGVAEAEIEDMVAILLGVSDFRRGTLILLPDDEERLPETVGYTDNSKLGTTLYQSLIGRKISELRHRGVALGMLTSDGLTTVAKSGQVLGCGEIVRIGRLHGNQQRAGGGRTHAAIAASRYGLVIMISEDGPITFFKDGREQIQIVL